ncbi:hypothetical protein N656DRAFT_780302 [Canariomyces notabilis]|uniref:Uncharacterized protein n=1 Tax=Canariomyces notabilis TaxID=2074819 RepID=A0AAN6TC11_9PEZI|nr:hypothetical protein N656DRAFT_780302 [Canariomyces arenarius]
MYHTIWVPSSALSLAHPIPSLPSVGRMTAWCHNGFWAVMLAASVRNCHRPPSGAASGTRASRQSPIRNWVFGEVRKRGSALLYTVRSSGGWTSGSVNAMLFLDRKGRTVLRRSAPQYPSCDPARLVSTSMS